MKPERFTACFFVCTVIGMMMFSVVSLSAKQIRKLTEKPLKEPLIIDWEKLYPFADGRTHSEPEKESLYEYVKIKLEQYTSKYLLGYTKIVEASKKYEDIVRWNMVSVFDYNAVVKLKDGYLTSYTTSLYVTQDAEAVKNFADFCAEKGIDFMYINFPAKICQSDNVSGVLDFTNQNADKFLAMLKESGVRYYDFRKNLHEAGMNHYEAFYVTDHHWKAETGLWAAGEILKILRDGLSWDVEPEILRPENFRYEVFREWFLGSEGKKVTLARTKPDNFTMIYPKFPVSIHFSVPDIELNVSGDFGITYDMKAVNLRDYYGKNPYGAYIYGDHPLIRIENINAANHKKILIIHESMSNCVIPFVALGVQRVYAVDLRHFTGSIRNFVYTVRPDAVVVMYYATVPGRGLKPSATREEKRFYIMQ